MTSESERKQRPEHIEASKPLKNQRHEIFAQEVAKGTKTSLAYKAAGYAAKDPDVIYTVASRLLRSARIARRVAWLQQQAADCAIITKESLINDCRMYVKKAADAEQYAAVFKGLQMLGLERGTFIPKQENGRPGDFSEMKTDELVDYVARRIGAGGGSVPGTRAPGTSNGAGSQVH